MRTTPEQSPLGKTSAYITQYEPSLLFPIPRQSKRDELGLSTDKALPFFGVDIWNAYEVSWLNPRGKPQVAIVQCTVPADSPNLIESKSFKLYLNSFNQTRLAGPEALQQLLQQDLSEACGRSVQIKIILPEAFETLQLGHLDGVLLDRLDLDIDSYTPAPERLTTVADEAPVEEVLVSHLLKSNCLVTGQPDWASIQIRYVGSPIDHAGLLRYLIGFRNHNEFHEQCVERIFSDITQRCAPNKLAVYARYTRRGGLDINPFRTNFNAPWPANVRLARQ